MSGGASSARRGSSYERELVNKFAAAGWGALRLPSSGAATDRELPDVLAGQPVTVPAPGTPTVTEAWAVELKSGKGTTLYVDASEVEDLCAFTETWGARPLLGARFTTQASGTETWLLRPEDARMTDGGAYGLPVDDVAERAYAAVSADAVERL